MLNLDHTETALRWLTAANRLSDALDAWNAVSPETSSIIEHERQAALWNAAYWQRRAHTNDARTARAEADRIAPGGGLINGECPLCLRSDED